jgi:hypothetical protein
MPFEILALQQSKPTPSLAQCERRETLNVALHDGNAFSVYSSYRGRRRSLEHQRLTSTAFDER